MAESRNSTKHPFQRAARRGNEMAKTIECVTGFLADRMSEIHGVRFDVQINHDAQFIAISGSCVQRSVTPRKGQV